MVRLLFREGEEAFEKFRVMYILNKKPRNFKLFSWFFLRFTFTSVFFMRKPWNNFYSTPVNSNIFFGFRKKYC